MWADPFDVLIAVNAHRWPERNSLHGRWEPWAIGSRPTFGGRHAGNRDSYRSIGTRMRRLRPAGEDGRRPQGPAADVDQHGGAGQAAGPVRAPEEFARSENGVADPRQQPRVVLRDARHRDIRVPARVDARALG